MTTEEIKTTLQKQMQLLVERSKKCCEAAELNELSKTVLSIAVALLSL